MRAAPPSPPALLAPSAPLAWCALLDGRGPDHFMELVFDRDVRELVRDLDTTGFVRTEMAATPMASEFRGSTACDGFDFYADAFHSEQLLANLRGTAPMNVWHYQAMLVGARRVWLEHGYGAAFADVIVAEMRLLGRAMDAGSGLISWSIEFGGQGYPGGVVCAGRTVAELVKHLTRPAPSP